MSLSDTDLQHFKALLLKLKTGLLKAGETGQQAEEVVELDQTRVGRLSRMDAMQAQAMSLETGTGHVTGNRPAPAAIYTGNRCSA